MSVTRWILSGTVVVWVVYLTATMSGVRPLPDTPARPAILAALAVATVLVGAAALIEHAVREVEACAGTIAYRAGYRAGYSAGSAGRPATPRPLAGLDGAIVDAGVRISRRLGTGDG
jgi:hypothetical protein